MESDVLVKLFKQFISFCYKFFGLVTELTEGKKNCGLGKEQELSW